MCEHFGVYFQLIALNILLSALCNLLFIPQSPKKIRRKEGGGNKKKETIRRIKHSE